MRSSWSFATRNEWTLLAQRWAYRIVAIVAVAAIPIISVGPSPLAAQQTAVEPPMPLVQTPVIEVEFTNARLQPAHWLLTIHPDGSGEFQANGGVTPAGDINQIGAGDVDRPIQLSSAFTARAFAAAREHKLFAFPCESHMKVAFQGTKRLSYTGPEGSGSCEFNYSKVKEIQALGDSFLAVENTLLFGARLEKMLQHDRLGLDLELENLAAAAHEGSAIEFGVIADTLNKIAADDQVLDRARKKARLLLAQS